MYQFSIGNLYQFTSGSDKRAYRNALEDFMQFTGIERPDEFREISRAHIIAWRDDLKYRELTTISPAAGGVARSWKTIDGFTQEVANARIYGVHYRNSGEIGTAMGKQIGELAATKYLRPVK